MRFNQLKAGAALCALMLGSTTAQAQSTEERKVLPIASKPFAGKIGDTVADSTPAFPARVQAPAGAPNILLVMTDDVGFAASSTFGGPIPTPNLDRLAQRGLKYNNFHTTAMCSPTRASLLTGRNAHNVGFGLLTETLTGYPGYNGVIPRSAATAAKVLQLNGYSTAMFGKHHNTPPSQISVAGPFDMWPTGLGFDYFYGFVSAQSDQWIPGLIRGTSRIEPPEGVHFDQMLADDAIHWIHNQKAAAPGKPFFIYMAPSSGHAPLQAPKEWIDRFKGQFDGGWDALREQIFARQKAMGVIPQDAQLTPRNEMVEAWDTFSADEQKVAARLMEVFAGAVAFQDHQFGRVVDELERMGQLENTLVVFLQGDNGATPEGGRIGTTDDTGMLANMHQPPLSWLLEQIDQHGGPESHAHYPRGWAWAMNTPFPWFKRFGSHLGGIRNGLVVSWPARIAEVGGLRTSFQHVSDVAPTLLAAAGVPQPISVEGVQQQPIDGVSMIDSFAANPPSPAPRTQYFELLGNRSIYKDGWLASTEPPAIARQTDTAVKSDLSPLEYTWELYDLRSDFSQANNVADKFPQKLKEMQDLWWQEARRNNVLPLDNLLSQQRVQAEMAAFNPPRHRYTYWGNDIRLDRGVAPPILAHSFRIDADVTVPEAGGSGVLVAAGDNYAGLSFYLKDGKPMVAVAMTDEPQDKFHLAAPRRVAAGKARISYAFDYVPNSRKAKVTILVNGEPQASGEFDKRINIYTITETFDTGQDTGRPVTEDYATYGPFNGAIDRIDVILKDVPEKEVATR